MLLVFAFESQHHLGKSCRVRGEIFRANRHVRKLHENARKSPAKQGNSAEARRPLRHLRDHSRPLREPRSASPIEPPSRALSPREPEARQSPLPRAILSPVPAPSRRKREASTIRSLGAEHENVAAVGRHPNPSATSATKPCTPFRKSIGCVATNTRTSGPNDITASTSPPPTPAPASRRRRRRPRAPSRRRSSPRSVRSDPQKRELGPSCPAAPQLRRRA